MLWSSPIGTCFARLVLVKVREVRVQSFLRVLHVYNACLMFVLYENELGVVLLVFLGLHV